MKVIVLAVLVAAVAAEDYAAPAPKVAAAYKEPSYGYGDSYGHGDGGGGYGYEPSYGYDDKGPQAPKGYGQPAPLKGYDGGYGYDAGYGKEPSYGHDAGYGKGHGGGYGHEGGHGGGHGYKYGYLGFIHPYGKNPYEPDKYADCPQGHYCGKLVGYGGQCKGKYDGFYPDKDCNKYHQCSNGYDYLLACPYGLHWSSKYYRCVYPVHSECGGYGGGYA